MLSLGRYMMEIHSNKKNIDLSLSLDITVGPDHMGKFVNDFDVINKFKGAAQCRPLTIHGKSL